jgi:hypothetical protein
MSSVKGQELSEYLKSMVRAGMLRQDMAEELNVLPTKELQRQAYRLLPEACLDAARAVVEEERSARRITPRHAETGVSGSSTHGCHLHRWSSRADPLDTPGG